MSCLGWVQGRGGGGVVWGLGGGYAATPCDDDGLWISAVAYVCAEAAIFAFHALADDADLGIRTHKYVCMHKRIVCMMM